MTEKTARQLAHTMALYIATEHSLVAHRNDGTGIELVPLADRWLALAEEINVLKRRGEHESLTAPLRDENDEPITVPPDAEHS